MFALAEVFSTSASGKHDGFFIPANGALGALAVATQHLSFSSLKAQMKRNIIFFASESLHRFIDYGFGEREKIILIYLMALNRN